MFVLTWEKYPKASQSDSQSFRFSFSRELKAKIYCVSIHDNGEIAEKVPGSQIVWTWSQAPNFCLCYTDWMMHVITENFKSVLLWLCSLGNFTPLMIFFLI